MKQSVPYPELDTPAVIVDMDKLEANIEDAQRLADNGDVKIRPVSKCHESAEITKMQIKAGGIGVTVGKLKEALHMADEGIGGILILHPFYGPHKMEQLKELVSRPNIELHACTVDMVEQAEAISAVGQAVGKKIPVLLKIETGLKRFGVLPGEPALQRAKELVKIPGIELVGILGHESSSGLSENTKGGWDKVCHEVAAVMAATARLLRNNGIPIEHVEIGATPALRNVPMLRGYPEITEIHMASYIFGDIGYVTQFALPMERVSLFVLTTVVSLPDTVPARAVIDAGSKTIPLVPMHPQYKPGEPGYLFDGKPCFGQIVGRPDLWLGRLTIVNGVVFFTDPDKKVELGERLEIITTHHAILTGVHRRIYGVRKGKVEKMLKDVDTGSY
jgi:D-serine deaminase-like pyridoxal phosphate-dependent protein